MNLKAGTFTSNFQWRENVFQRWKYDMGKFFLEFHRVLSSSGKKFVYCAKIALCSFANGAKNGELSLFLDLQPVPGGDSSAFEACLRLLRGFGWKLEGSGEEVDKSIGKKEAIWPWDEEEERDAFRVLFCHTLSEPAVCRFSRTGST